MSAPQPLTMERLDEQHDLILAQSTSMCCRHHCLQPSINWVLSEGSNYEPGKNPFELDHVGWIHEESTWCGRTWSCILPGCREIKYVQHSGPVPEALTLENKSCCTCQFGRTTPGLEESDITKDVVATHEKNCTCGYCLNCSDLQIPICNCFPLPYLETKTADGKVIGKSLYICDGCLFVPKYDVFDANNNKKYRVRPDTCCGGCCVKCNCGGKKGKCFRVPFYILHPETYEHIESSGTEEHAQMSELYTGVLNELCTEKNAYHLAYPKDITPEDKLLLTGSALLVDITMFEQKSNNDSGGGGGGE